MMTTKIIAGILVGGLVGFANYRFIGCTSGSCPLTSHPVISTLFGMVVGGFIGGSFR